MDDINVHEIDYKDNHLIIKVVGQKKVSNYKLTVLRVSIIRNHEICLGNFYTKFPHVVNDDYIYEFSKNLIDNIDTIIFKNNRYIGPKKEIAKSLSAGNAHKALAQIYSEFLKIPKKSHDYIKYSRFLELYFHGHDIPDLIKKMYLERENKSILDFDDINSAIRSEFCCNIKELKDEFEYECDVKSLEKLNCELEFRNKETGLLKEIINNVKSLVNKIKENDEINVSIDELESRLREISFFDKSRKEIKGTLNTLVNSLNLIDIEEQRGKIHEMFSNYASVYGDNRGLLVVFDNLSLEDILSVLEDIYKVRKYSCSELISKIDELNKKILNYKDELVDISDLYDRLES